MYGSKSQSRRDGGRRSDSRKEGSDVVDEERVYGCNGHILTYHRFCTYGWVTYNTLVLRSVGWSEHSPVFDGLILVLVDLCMWVENTEF
jgi:hypothetical protein